MDGRDLDWYISTARWMAESFGSVLPADWAPAAVAKLVEKQLKVGVAPFADAPSFKALAMRCVCAAHLLSAHAQVLGVHVAYAGRVHGQASTEFGPKVAPAAV